MTGQNVEPVDGSDATDRRWRVAGSVAADGADPLACWPLVIDPRAALPASIEELSQKIASGGLWPVLVRVVGTWIAGREVLVRRVLPEELFA